MLGVGGVTMENTIGNMFSMFQTLAPKQSNCVLAPLNNHHMYAA